VTTEGTKVPLGLWIGSTENAVVATELLQNFVERGLRVDGPLLFVIDGGKGIRKALRDVFGDRAVVQRCQVHKREACLERGCNFPRDAPVFEQHRGR
jgi:transposase-like protein